MYQVVKHNTLFLVEYINIYIIIINIFMIANHTGSDYDPLVDQMLTFSVGATQVCQLLTVKQDNLLEENEFLEVVISSTAFSVRFNFNEAQVNIEDSDCEF